jgi:hypothetical protein
MALSFQLKQKGPNAAHGKARLTKEELAEERVQLVLPAINEPLITPAELRFNLTQATSERVRECPPRHMGELVPSIDTTVTTDIHIIRRIFFRHFRTLILPGMSFSRGRTT